MCFPDLRDHDTAFADHVEPSMGTAWALVRYIGIDAWFGEMHMADNKSAILYRMILPDHTCPFGVRAKQMLEGAGFQVDDRILNSREAVDAFEGEQGVATTPQIFIDDERIGGSDDLERYLERA